MKRAIALRLEDVRLIALIYNQYALLHLESGDVEKAAEMLEKSQTIAEEHSQLESLCQVHAGWAQYWIAYARRYPDSISPTHALAKARAALAKAVEFGEKSGSTAEIGGDREIAKARAAIEDFAREHGVEM